MKTNYYIACDIRLASGNKATEVFLDGHHKTITVTMCDPHEYYSYELGQLSTEDQAIVLKAIANYIGSDRLKSFVR